MTDRLIHSFIDQLFFTRVNLKSLFYCKVFLLCKDPRTRQIIPPIIFTHINRYYCTVFLVCKDPRTRQIWPVIYTHCQSLLLHSIFVMKRSPHYSRQIRPVIYTRQSLLLHSIVVICKDPRKLSAKHFTVPMYMQAAIYNAILHIGTTVNH